MTTEFQEKIRSVQFGSVPGGTRAGRERTDQINQTEKNWERDMPAYRRLRADGLQPRNVDGAAHLEAKANDSLEVSNGLLMTDPKIPARMKELKAEADSKDVGI
jgi:hypothetical protein